MEYRDRGFPILSTVLLYKVDQSGCIRPDHPESRTLLCSGQLPFADDRKSSCAERIVAALLIIKGFASVVKLILPGCYPKGTKLYWVVQGGCSGCPLLQRFPCHLLGQEETKSTFKFSPLQVLVVADFSGLTRVFWRNS